MAATWKEIVTGILNSRITDPAASMAGLLGATPWTFSSLVTFTHSNSSIRLDAAIPMMQLNENDQAANGKLWKLFAQSGVVQFTATNDADSVDRAVFAFTRSGNAVSALAFGNATDNPPYTFLGTGLTTFSGALSVPAGSVGVPAIAIGDANSGFYGGAGDTQLSADGTVQFRWISGICIATTTTARGSGNIYYAMNDSTGEKGYFGYGGADDIFSIKSHLNANMVFATNDVTVLTLTPAGTATFGGVLLGPAGAVGAPSHSFSGQPTDGIYSSSAGVIGVAIGGAQSVAFANGVISIGAGFAAGDRIALVNSTARSASNLSYFFNNSLSGTTLNIYGYDGTTTAVGTLTLDFLKVNFQNLATTTTAPGAGGAGALPATPAGYVTVTIAGTDRKIAYY
jgi:hypothetical protein